MEGEKTQSEIVFEHICNTRKIPFESIPCKEDPTPDYILHIDNIEIVAEVKQLDPNVEDLQRLHQVFHKNKAIGLFPKQKKRIRKKIDKASRQLKKISKGINPSIIILYDNTNGFSGLNGYGILTSMYGDEKSPILVNRERESEPYIGEAKFGGGRKMTKKEKKHISAIGMMKRIFEEPEIYLYHNIYADIPINPAIASSLASRQFTINEGNPNAFQEWQEIKL